MVPLQKIKSLVPLLNSEERKELRALLFMNMLRDFANKFVLFFLPIFLFQLGRNSEIFSFLPISDLTKGIWAVAGYFVFFGIAGVATGVFSANYLIKTSYGTALTTSLLVLSVQYLMLFSLQSYPLWWLWVLAAAVDGFQASMYWQSLQSLLSKHSRRARMGKRLGSVQLMTQLVGVIGPAVGSMIALYAGLHTLFLTGLATSVLASIVAFSVKRVETTDRVNFKEFFSWMKEKRFRMSVFSSAGKIIKDDVTFVWPLYLFLLLGSIDSVGFLYSLSLFLALLTTMFVGSYVDNHKSKKPFYASGGVLSLVWFAKMQVFNPFAIAIADAVDNLATNIHTLFFDTLHMRRGKGSNAPSFFTYHRLITSSTRIIFWSVFGGIFLIFPSWKTLFVLAGVGVMVSLLVKEHRDETIEI